MNEKINIAVILGTSRTNRRSEHVARFVESIGKQQENVEIMFVDPRDFEMPRDGNNEDEVNQDYQNIVIKADAFFIVTPEYNHGYPGSLKRLLDDIKLKHYIHKPIVLAGVSNGQWGGVRAIENIIPVLRELGMIVSFADVQFPKVQEIFDEEGNLLNEDMTKRVQRSYTELIWLARTMKHGIENLPNKYHEES